MPGAGWARAGCGRRGASSCRDRVETPQSAGQKEDLLLNAGGEVEEPHDLGHAGTGDSTKVREVRVVRHHPEAAPVHQFLAREPNSPRFLRFSAPLSELVKRLSETSFGSVFGSYEAV